ncbi:hypothetical protein NDU88_004610 [Pleurodeles waltl]|uniref:Uncharacterized protein n=1 Tax=Pleurodeles waltl TaxID=8319 RepID=A0AAV7MUE2_PLEWA|nr:hypothetical protein NDU88_004610 [Pleurodeles waltl]
MGKHDAKQPKLNFDHKRCTHQGELEQGPQEEERRDLAADDKDEDLRTLMLEMRSSLRNIDTKLDNLTNQLDSVKTQVATHEMRLDTLEARQSECNEFQVETRDQLLHMDIFIGYNPSEE